MCVAARELACCPIARVLCAGLHVPGWFWRLWIVLVCGVMGLVMMSCQPVSRPTPPPSEPSEPHFLPGLTVPQTRPVPGTAPPSPEQQAAFTAAEALRTSRQYIQARQAFADFVRRYPESALTDDALFALGHISATLEQYALAVAYYRSLLARFPRSARVPEAHVGLGIALYHTHDYANSLIALRQYLSLMPSGAQQGLAHYYLGAVALKQQRYPDAIAALTVAVETSPDPAVVQQAREHIARTVRQDLTVDGPGIPGAAVCQDLSW